MALDSRTEMVAFALQYDPEVLTSAGNFLRSYTRPRVNQVALQQLFGGGQR